MAMKQLSLKSPTLADATIANNPDLDKKAEARQKIGISRAASSPLSSVDLSNAYGRYDEKQGAALELESAATQGRDIAADNINSQQQNYNAAAVAHNQNVDYLKNQDTLVAKAEAARKQLADAKAKFDLQQTSKGNMPDLDFSGLQGGQVGSISGINLSGLGLSQAQQENAKKIIAVGAQRGESNKNIQIAIMTAMTESSLINVKGGDRDSAGLFQQRPSQGWGTYAQVTNTTYSITKFFKALANTKQGATPWKTAQNVQRSAFADGSNYAKWYSLSSKIMARAVNPVGAASSAKVSGNLKSFMNTHMGKYTDYDGAYGTQCVDLFRYYLKSLGQPQISSVGSAKNIWTNKQMGANNTRIGRGSVGKSGDIAVFGGAIGGGHGHVGIVLQDMGDKVKIFNSHSGNKRTDITIISKSSLLGYWRPKR